MDNLTFYTGLKRLNTKTVGYLKPTKMHDKVIGTLIEHKYSL
ncbi:IS1 family transposase [Candidatus Enterovibrio altilux]|uniref:Uncharacterized protein n=1 Tax=Candidatus Enterovibrio altilux TaxID=1927128 RepID=A0A291BAK8_9GAMM|nr:IS1 family transposase [Candidatus Enterovibrio luxaltus]ATF10049.1 hypothetical protein BTN50_1607 [Candidatus Enterovibrio luxaltus]